MHSRMRPVGRPQDHSVVASCFEPLEGRTLLSAAAALPQAAAPGRGAGAQPDDAHAQATPTDSYYAGGSLWGLDKVSAPAAWDVSTGSSRVVVAGVDSGVDYTHPDLYKNVWINQGEIPAAARGALADADADGLITFWDLNDPANAGKVADGNANGYVDGGDVLAQWSNGADDDRNVLTVGRKKYVFKDDLIGWNFLANNNNPWDDHGHGTHTAGTLAASGNDGGVVGVSWRAQFMALKFLDANSYGLASTGALAIRYAAFNKAQLSNNSWVSNGGNRGDEVYSAIKYARSLGHLVVAAAGNNGVDNDASKSRTYPASYDLDNIISVAASDPNDAKAGFSNYGKTSVDLAAPGVNVLSTMPGGGYGYMSGTSMATPHVAGTAALLWSADAGLSYAGVKGRILNNVDKVAGLTNYTLTGGRLNAHHALTNAKAGGAATATSTGSTGTTGTGTGGGASAPWAAGDAEADGPLGASGAAAGAGSLADQVAAAARVWA